MKGVHYLTDEHNAKKAVVIDFEALSDLEAVAGLLQGIIAEMRKDEERIPFKTVIENLKKAGKIS